MKNVIILFVPLLISLFSCDNSKNIGKDDICDKTFQEETFLSNIGMTVTRNTVLKCDGTFKSGVSYSQITEGELGGSDNLSGSWEVVNSIPESIVDAVREYGLKDDNYSIIKYSSSNGISGYCLYYKEQSYYLLKPLYLDQIPLNRYEDSGSLGIWGGYLK